MANKITYINLAPLYKAEKNPEITGLRIFHENDSVSTVFVKYNPANFLYQDQPGTSYRKANYSIAFILYPSYESKLILDSTTFFLSDSLNFGKTIGLVYNFPVKARYPGNYLLEVQLTDLNAETSTLFPQIISKETRNDAQNFLPVNKDHQIIFEDWISSLTNFRIITSNDTLTKLFVRVYNREFPVALPPFSKAKQEMYNYNSDDVLTIKIEHKETGLLSFPKEGFYHFQADTSQRNGLTLFRFYDCYPKVTVATQLVPPLRYLTSNKEFRQLLITKNQKTAVDSFWIFSAGNEDRALEIIKQYYSRVETANQLFTSFNEGWKTDRGMIYIIFGAPKTVYRRDEIETWVYGEPGNRVLLTFDFIKAINPFTCYDYILQRQSDYKNPWFIAVDYWRR
jgi:GWxTD domain-containing protein